MSTTLDAVTLPEDLLWVDEYAYTPVKQTVAIALDGSQIIEAAAQSAGRPITLQGGDNYAWIDKATLELLRLKQATPGLQMTLILLGVSYNVLFVQPGGIEAKPIIDYSDPDSSDLYSVTLKFFEV